MRNKHNKTGSDKKLTNRTRIVQHTSGKTMIPAHVLYSVAVQTSLQLKEVRPDESTYHGKVNNCEDIDVTIWRSESSHKIQGCLSTGNSWNNPAREWFKVLQWDLYFTAGGYKPLHHSLHLTRIHLDLTLRDDILQDRYWRLLKIPLFSFYKQLLF